MRKRQPVGILVLVALVAIGSLAADRPATPVANGAAPGKSGAPSETAAAEKDIVPDDAVEAISKPSGDVRLAMTEPGLIAKVLVKDGSPVKAGDVLIQLDDEVRKVELAFAKAEAESTIRVEAAVLTLEQKTVYYKRLATVGALATSDTERELAKLDVDIATKQWELEQLQQGQNALKVKELSLRIDRMKIVSPIDGKVEQVVVKDGEALDSMAQVIRVVNVDPLWIDVPMPMGKAETLAKALKNGDGGATVSVCFPDADGRPDGESTCAGTVIHVAQVADGASQSRVVRVEVPNPGDRPAGEHVWVWMNR